MLGRLSVMAAVSLSLGFFLNPTTVFAQGASGGGGGQGATKENLDLPFDAMGDSEDEEEAPEMIVFYSTQYEGDGFFYSCDKSGSMNDESKLNKLKQEVTKNITQFSDHVQFGICLFDAGLTKFPSNGRPADANPGMKSAGIQFVMSTVAGHGTCSQPSLLQCLQYAAQASAKRKLIIHLSDGRNTCPNTEEAVYAEQTLNIVTSRNTQRVKINTIQIGSDSVGEDFMKKLASMNGGKATKVP